MKDWVPDKGQQQAIDHGPGPLVVDAGAGTGKTSTIMRRIGRLVESGTDPWRILAITFTQKAAAELRERLAADARRVEARTIHAFCMGLLHRHYQVGGEHVLVSIMDDDECKSLRKAIVKPWIDCSPEGGGDDPLEAEASLDLADGVLEGRFDWPGFLDMQRSYYGWRQDDQVGSRRWRSATMRVVNSLAKGAGTAIGLMYNANRSAAENMAAIRDGLRRRSPQDGLYGMDEHLIVFNAMTAVRYEETMRRRRSADFDFMLRLTWEMLDQDPAVLRLVQSRYDDVFIDEYQDTSQVQVDIAEQVAGGRASLVVVGDPDQSIYSWRGAAIGTMDDFARRHGDADVVHITVNHRSVQPILDAANAVIGDNPTDVIDRHELVASEDHRRDPSVQGDPRPVLALFSTGADEARAVADGIVRARQEGVPYRGMGVLMRTHSLGATVSRELRHRRIPYAEVGVTPFYARTVVKDLMAYLTVLYNPQDDAAMLRILNKPRRGLGEGFTDALTREQGSMPMHVPLLEIMGHLLRDEGRFDRTRRGAARDFMAVFAHACDDGYGVAPVLKALTGPRSGYHAMLEEAANQGTDEEKRKAQDDLALYDDVVDMAEQFDRERRDRPLDVDGARRSVADFTAWMDTQAEATRGPQAEAVSVMTVHAAKGLEYDSVWLLGADQNVFPSAMSLREGRIDEERRLMYVALTRARRRLTVTHADSRIMYGQAVSGALSGLLSGHLDKFRIEDRRRD